MNERDFKTAKEIAEEQGIEPRKIVGTIEALTPIQELIMEYYGLKEIKKDCKKEQNKILKKLGIKHAYQLAELEKEAFNYE